MHSYSGRLVLFVVSVLALAACDQAAPARSVQFYKDHSDERVQTMEACRQQQQASDDCENAAAAGLIDAQREPLPRPAFPTKPAQ